MHAIVGVFKMDPIKQAEQRVGLHELIIPFVRQHPGFVTGYWSHDPSSARHFSHIVLENEESARTLAAAVLANGPEQGKAGVEIESLTVVEVIGQASR